MHKRLLLTMRLLWPLVACLLSLRELQAGVNVTRVIRGTEVLLRRQKRYLAFPTGSNLVVGYDAPNMEMLCIDWFRCSWQCRSLRRSCRNNRRVTMLLGSVTCHFHCQMILGHLPIGISRTRGREERCTLFWWNQWNGTFRFSFLYRLTTLKRFLFGANGVGAGTVVTSTI